MFSKTYFMKVSRAIVILVFFCGTFLMFTYSFKPYKEIGKKLDTSLLNRKKATQHFILQWTNRFKAPFLFMGEGNSSFVKNKCEYVNCFVTNNKSYFRNLLDFDAIVFNGVDVVHPLSSKLPQKRSPKQKYIFGAMESSDNWPVCDKIFDGYFNWTWTYKLDSDFRWGYITIYDLNGNIVGPAADMKWPEMTPIEEETKVILSNKTKAAAWFVSHCPVKSKRRKFIDELQKELRLYGWKVDIYGKCGSLKCAKKDWQSCHQLLKKDYFFYIAFENSFAEDYVTEKLLLALNNFALPVVYGGANYSRFLPPGSYLDAKMLGPKKLARRMNEIIGDKNAYYNFFRWRNHFTYRETSSKEDICKLCEMMNNIEKRSQMSVWNDFRTWWNGARYKINCKV